MRRSSSVRQSAGILLFRRTSSGGLEVLLAHPGGPFWSKRDLGAWTMPKGEFELDEQPETAALREFEEETGSRLEAEPIPLGDVTQRGGKRVFGFAVEGDLDPASLVSNEFELEWPPRSGQLRRFPEIDRAAWFALDLARDKMLPAQTAFLDRLHDMVAEPRPTIAEDAIGSQASEVTSGGNGRAAC